MIPAVTAMMIQVGFLFFSNGCFVRIFSDQDDFESSRKFFEDNQDTGDQGLQGEFF